MPPPTPPRPQHALVLHKREQTAVKNTPLALAHATIQTILTGIPEEDGSVTGREVGGANRAINTPPPRRPPPARYPTPPREGSDKLQLSGAQMSVHRGDRPLAWTSQTIKQQQLKKNKNPKATKVSDDSSFSFTFIHQSKHLSITYIREPDPGPDPILDLILD